MDSLLSVTMLKVNEIWSHFGLGIIFEWFCFMWFYHRIYYYCFLLWRLQFNFFIVGFLNFSWTP